ncbi:MAG: TetR/AcrR family transcriptional regulator [Candidatus Limnocylindria bacterium]
MSPPEVRRLRTDAERNRARIIEAATAAFARRGLDVPLDEVADDAGVGIGTLYRRFSGRDELIGACFERRLAEYADAAEEALNAPDGWSGFASYLERICAMQAADRGLADVMNRSLPNAKALEAHRTRGYELSLRLIERAQAEGSLRPDVVAEDLALLFMANAGVVEVTTGSARDAWRRFVRIFLDGMRSEGASALPPAPTPRQTMRAMRRMTRTG